MTNKEELQKDNVSKIKPAVNPVKKNDAKNTMPEKDAEKKEKKPSEKSSTFDPASVGRSAVDAVTAHSSRDVKGSSGLADTGPVTSYE